VSLEFGDHLADPRNRAELSALEEASTPET